MSWGPRPGYPRARPLTAFGAKHGEERVAVPPFSDTRLERLHTVACSRGLNPATGAGSRPLTVAVSPCRAATVRAGGHRAFDPHLSVREGEQDSPQPRLGHHP